jgi:hypothetical protein
LLNLCYYNIRNGYKYCVCISEYDDVYVYVVVDDDDDDDDDGGGFNNDDNY